jgi:hypothetical protein
MRQACALGLNLQNDSKTVSDSSKEIRSRVWWAVCSAEFRLSVMTGRPSAFTNVDFTVSLPRPVEEESFLVPRHAAFSNQDVALHHRYSRPESRYTENSPSNQSSGSSTRVKVSPAASPTPAFPHPTLDGHGAIPPSHAMYFLIQTKLSLFTNEVLHQLYRSRVVAKSWAQIQAVISALVIKLEKWQSALPPVFDFSKKQRDQQFSRQRMSLGFFYYSTLMIISRPCLCRINRKLPHASEKYREFNRATAAKCVHAAKDMLGLLPNEPNPIGLYKVTPWWCLVHHLVQAATVSMLELSYQADHLPHEVEEILQSARKAVQWLHSMAEEDLAAHRAWRLCDDMLQKVASKVGRQFDIQPEGDLPDGELPDEHLPDHEGNCDGTSFNYSYPLTDSMDAPYIHSARPEEAGTFGANHTPFNPTDGLHQQGLFREGLPLQALMYTSYDEFFPPSPFFQQPPPMTAPELPADFLSMFPSPYQMDGVLSGDLDDRGMPKIGQGRS